VTTYHEDFADPRSGWPNRAGSRYVQGAYELSVPGTPGDSDELAPHGNPWQSAARETAPQYGGGALAAYGPWWQNFRASVSIEGHGSAARGMVFRLNDAGCYVLLLSGAGKAGDVSFRLVRKLFPSYLEVPLIPWTPITGPALADMSSGGMANRITVECIHDRIKILLNDMEVTRIVDSSYAEGYVGLAHYGSGHTLFRDLRVEGLP
jgi:hypothetical protein